MKPVYFSGGIPSNFHRATILVYSPVLDDEVVFVSNEHYFQCAKTFLIEDEDAALWFHEKIRGTRYGADAKKLGRKVPLPTWSRRKWDNTHAPIAMLTCNLAKYHQNSYCAKWLKDTGSRPLVEHRLDPIWGDNLDGTGRNLLGKVLELVRARVRG